MVIQKTNDKLKKYSRSKKLFVSLIILCIALSPVMYFAYKDKMYSIFNVMLLGFTIIIISLIRLKTEHIIICNDKIMKVIKYPYKKYELQFNEISMIVDDDISTLGMDLHVYHLIPKEGLEKNFKRFTIHTGIQNRKELMVEIVSRVDKTTKIEQSIFDYIE